jgi:hypothetical protein
MVAPHRALNKRDLVRRTAELLREKIGDRKIFFDEWFEAELAGQFDLTSHLTPFTLHPNQQYPYSALA